MSCLAAVSVLACILSPQNLEVEATAASDLAGDFTFYSDGRLVSNAVYGRFALEMKPQLTENLRLVYGFEHLSVINASDRGVERFFAGFVWTPFKRN